MKKCPVCNVDLVPVDYEGFRVLQCRQCGGHLVPLQRFESIKRVDGMSREGLKAEASRHFTGSSEAALRCPRCHLLMRKELTDMPVLELETDVCRSCAVVWLDGGELALLQLAHQAQQRFINAQDLRRRMEELEASPERMARFEANLAMCDEANDPLTAAFEEVGDDLLGALLRSSFPRTKSA